MKPGSRFVAACIATAMALVATAAHAGLTISEPWVRAAADGRSAEAFVQIQSSDDAILIGVDSFAAKSIAIRAPGAKRALNELALPANVPVHLKPGGDRIAMSGLVRRLKPGERVPITLIIRSASGTRQMIYINAEVRQRSPTEDELGSHAQHSHGK